MDIKAFLASTARLARGLYQYKRKLLRCPYPPYRVWIEPTNDCNLRCGMCPSERSRRQFGPGYMSMPVYEKIIDQLSGYADSINLFMRGEPLLHERLTDMIMYAKGKGLKVRLETNAVLLSEEYSRKLLGTELDFLSFSFDGYTKDVYETIRRGAFYEKTMGNITGFLSMKKRLKKRKPYTLIQVIETDELKKRSTKEDERSFKRIFRENPPDGFRIISPHRFGGIMPAGAEHKTGKTERVRCQYPWFSLAVLWDGTVTACCMDFMGRNRIGDMKVSQIKDIWNCEEMYVLRDALKKPNVNGPCSACDLIWQRSVCGMPEKHMRDACLAIKEILKS